MKGFHIGILVISGFFFFFFLLLHENISYGYSLEALFNEYPIHNICFGREVRNIGIKNIPLKSVYDKCSTISTNNIKTINLFHSQGKVTR